MPPRKRKANDVDGDEGSQSPTPAKKSKKEMRAEAKAKAKAWHDARSGGATTTTAKSTPIPKDVRSSPAPASFSAGKSPSKTTTSPKRRRTPTRKSMGSSSPASSSVSSTGSRATQRKSRRSMPAKFEFAPPVQEEEEEEESMSDVETNDAAVQSENKTKKKSPIKIKAEVDSSDENSVEDNNNQEEEKKLSAKKAKKKQQLEAVRKLREEREKKGMKVVPTPPVVHHGTSSKKLKSPDPLPAPAAAVAAAKTSLTTTTTTLNSPDPPPSSSHSTTTMTKSKRPPASVAGLFSPQKRSSKHSNAHRPGKQQQQRYDPNSNTPFPTGGYKLPTAAYCGCGPTPGSNSSNGGNGTQTQQRNGSFTATGAFVRNDMDRDVVVGYSDERKMSAAAATKPSPPGRNGNVKETERMMDINAPPPPQPVNTPGMLSTAISNAMSLVSAAAGENQVRRAMMGIRGTTGGNNSDNNNQATRGGQQQQQVRVVPPRNVMMMTEQQMDDMNAAALDGKGGHDNQGPTDPPVAAVESSSTPYAATLRKFREGGVTNTNKPSGKSEMKQNGPDDDGTISTVAGENTSEVGQIVNTVNPPPADDVDEPEEEKLSFVKRAMGACLTIGKLVMFIQLGFATLYLASNTNWNTVIPSPETLLKSAESIVEHHHTPGQEFACFIDYPHQNFDMNDGDNANECEGKWKQCPHHGRCYKGKLRDCSDELYNDMTLFVVNERGDECVGSPEAKELTKLVQDALVKMTTNQVCRGRLTNEEDGSFPLFSMYMVAANVKDPSDEENVGLLPNALLWLEPVFDPKMVRYGSLSGDDADDLNAMGLGGGVAPNSLPLPTGCYLKLLLLELLGYLCTFSWKILTFAATKSWFLLTTYPVYTIGAGVFMKGFSIAHQTFKRRRKAKELYDSVLNLAYDLLADCDHEGWAALMLRDEVTNTLYPTKWSERQFIMDHVWPRVSLCIQADNRVRKFRKMAHGREQPHWDLAIQAKRSRKSIGTPGSSKNGEETPRRDP